MSIKVDHLTKSFGSQIVVNDLSFVADEKGVIGFLGPNGAGKSSTMKMITGFWKPDSGSIQVCGMDIDRDKKNIKRKIGYLPEGNPLYYDMYVREYLSFLASVRGVQNKKGRIDEVVHTTGLTSEAHKKTGQLSKGYKQRVGLAAAILDDPDVLILDEPTSGLDPNQIVEIRDLIKKLGHTKTILFSSHILQEIESICDRVLIINKGILVADDLISNLKSGSSSAAVITVRFNPTPKGEWYSNFSEIAGVQEEDGSFYLKTLDPDMLKKKLVTYSIENNLDIVSLGSRKDSLEEIFKKLTKQNNEE